MNIILKLHLKLQLMNQNSIINQTHFKTIAKLVITNTDKLIETINYIVTPPRVMVLAMHCKKQKNITIYTLQQMNSKILVLYNA